jgi:phosphomannomutase
MEINASIFKSYDIRGIYPAELNEEIAYKIGQVFVGYTGAKKVVIGQDSRLSSPALYQAIAKGITEAGSDVFYLGLVPVECIYFSTGHYNYDGGIMITASHNPKE